MLHHKYSQASSLPSGNAPSCDPGILMSLVIVVVAVSCQVRLKIILQVLLQLVECHRYQGSARKKRILVEKQLASFTLSSPVEIVLEARSQ